MAEPGRVSIPKGVVLWETALVRCTCVHGAHDHIEVTLTMEGAIIHQEVFADHGSATDFAIAKMRDYNSA